MVVTLLGILKLANLKQPLKALLPIVVTVSGIYTDTNELLPASA